MRSGWIHFRQAATPHSMHGHRYPPKEGAEAIPAARMLAASVQVLNWCKTGSARSAAQVRKKAVAAACAQQLRPLGCIAVAVFSEPRWFSMNA